MYIPARKYKRISRHYRLQLFRIIRAVVNLGALLVLFLGVVNWTGYTIKVQPPIYFDKIEQTRPLIIESEKIATPSATPTASPSATPGVKPKSELKIIREAVASEVREVAGVASYYSREGCIGCSKSLTMANGESLDDSALTLALTPEMVNTYKLLNDWVTVRNNKTGQTVRARVTDTGGFGKLDRIADLSVATRDAINCSNLCNITITY